jgi:uncharacterized protein YjiS (DUF1127 family)
MSCAAKRCSSASQFEARADLGTKRCSTWLGRVAAPACRALQRRRQRNRLLELDERQLSDIGVTKEQAREEARKPLWR